MSERAEEKEKGDKKEKKNWRERWSVGKNEKEREYRDS